MSGVETRSRLEQLQALARRVKHDLDIARAQQAWREAQRLEELAGKVDKDISRAGGERWLVRAITPPKRRTKTYVREHDTVVMHLERLGITARDVKEWAVSVGLLDAVRRGRVKGELVAAYEAAHPTTIEGAA